MRAEAEQRVEVEKAMMEDERQVFEEAVWVSAERHARAKVMRVDRERQVEARWRAAEEETAWMEAERRAVGMKRPLKFSFRLCSSYFSLDLSLRVCKTELSLKFSFRLAFQILDWLQIAFRIISDW